MKLSQDSFWQSQSIAPLIEALRTLSQQPRAAFYAPGHKHGQGIPQPLATLLGATVFRSDLPELPELDNLFAPSGTIKQAQSLAAVAFGADQTWFLVNGSTCGIIAAILATCGTGDKIIVPRNIHQSVIAGLILSGAVPVFINPEYNPLWDLPYSFTPEALEDALNQNSDVKAVLMVYPTYHGICGDIQAIAEVTHRHNIPLLVDEAHGAHFSFHPSLPLSALSAGADLAVQSTHKVLGAMTQASMLHLKGTRINPQRISQALQLVQSTSPSYLLLASLDGARQQMALQGQELLTNTIKLAQKARDEISQIQGLSVLNLDKVGLGFQYLDPTRLTVNVSCLGLNGFEVDEILHQQLGVTAELPMLSHLTFIVSIGNTEKDINQLINAFEILASQYGLNNIKPLPSSSDINNIKPLPTNPPPLSLSPRDAFFAPTEMVSIEDSIGRISSELICPYPPGIPVLMPGEIIRQEAINYLEYIQELGASITGCSDETLNTLKVILF